MISIQSKIQILRESTQGNELNQSELLEIVEENVKAFPSTLRKDLKNEIKNIYKDIKKCKALPYDSSSNDTSSHSFSHQS